MTKIELTNTHFGAWHIIDKAPSEIGECGTMQSYWNAVCTKCNHSFRFKTKNMRRMLNFPKGCPGCTRNNNGTWPSFRYGRNLNGFIDKNIKIYE